MVFYQVHKSCRHIYLFLTGLVSGSLVAILDSSYIVTLNYSTENFLFITITNKYVTIEYISAQMTSLDEVGTSVVRYLKLEPR